MRRPHSPRPIRIALLGLVFAGLLAACSNSSSSPSAPGNGQPLWLSALIASIESEPVTDPPSSITRYRYRGETVYFRPARCCDVFSDLYDASGTLVCHPDGGIAGGGDGRCPDFLAARTDPRLIWQDPRR